MDSLSGTNLVWIGIVFCVTQSAMFSGLNLAFFSLNRMELEAAAGSKNKAAVSVLAMRQDANFLLATILWGNVGINVLLALLSNSVLAGVAAFAFSTIFITVFGEIIPQAYFSRHALKMASRLVPVMRFYQLLLFPLAKPCAKALDLWLGKEGIAYLRERDLKHVIKTHAEADEAELDLLEGIGALNFLTIDDLSIADEGEAVHPKSIIKLPVLLDLPQFPSNDGSANDPFLRQVQASGEKWVILTDESEEPLVVLDADGYLRSTLFEIRKAGDAENSAINPYAFCHRPIVIRDPRRPMSDVIEQLKVGARADDDQVIDKDIVLLWGKQRKVITGADILGRLLRGIS